MCKNSNTLSVLFIWENKKYKKKTQTNPALFQRSQTIFRDGSLCLTDDDNSKFTDTADFQIHDRLCAWQ